MTHGKLDLRPQVITLNDILLPTVTFQKSHPKKSTGITGRRREGGREEGGLITIRSFMGHDEWLTVLIFLVPHRIQVYRTKIELPFTEEERELWSFPHDSLLPVKPPKDI